MAVKMEFEEIQKKLEILLREPIKPIPDESLSRFRKELEKKCPNSKKIYEEMKNCVPGGYEHQMVIDDPFPLTISKGLGSRLWDVDSNEYIDWLSGAGGIIMGHNYPPLRERIIKVLEDLCPATYLTNEYELKAVKLVKKHVPSIELFKFYQSGTEADMAAIRLARVYTKKKKIIKIGGAYHGWSDQLQYDMHVPGSGTMESQGIPDSCFKDVVAVPPNDLDLLEAQFKKFETKKGIAAIILEPLGPESGNIPVAPEYNKTVLELCEKYDSLLIFDEVVTGFRMGLGGAQEYFGIKPHLTTFGKLITHGFPSAGGLGGRADIMELIASGIEPGKEHATATGTYLGNPLSAAATYWALTYLEETRAAQKAAKLGDELTKKLNDLFENHGLPYFSYNFKSVVQFKTYAAINTDINIPGNIDKAIYRNECIRYIAMVLKAQNIITKRGATAFTTMAHTTEDMENFIMGFATILKLIPH